MFNNVSDVNIDVHNIESLVLCNELEFESSDFSVEISKKHRISSVAVPLMLFWCCDMVNMKK